MNATGESEVAVTRAGAVMTVRLNRPERLNAITPEMHDLLQAAFDEFARDSALRIAVLTGTGRGFCAGSDLKAIAARREADLPRLELPRSGYGGLAARFDLEKPTIAAVNGVAAGGGFELALACDLIVAADSARFALPETLVGQVAIAGGPQRLARQIPLKQAMAIALTGEFVSAEVGLAWGFVNEVVPDAKLADAVARWTDKILRGGPLGVQATKQLVQRGLETASLADALAGQDELPALVRWRASDERREGASAFAAKRAPTWAAP